VTDPLGAVQACIQDLHALMAELPDPAHTQMVAQALAILTKIQRDLMQTAAQATGTRQALIQQLGTLY
jgi:hypothetical protein